MDLDRRTAVIHYGKQVLCRVLGKAIKTANVQTAMALGIAYLAKIFDGKQLFDACFFCRTLVKDFAECRVDSRRKKGARDSAKMVTAMALGKYGFFRSDYFQAP